MQARARPRFCSRLFPGEASSFHNTKPALRHTIAAMNWTEGSLARHSRGKGWNEEAARQKQYFAKQRARKPNSTQTRGVAVDHFVPSYIVQSSTSTPQPSDANRKRLIHLSSDSGSERIRSATLPSLTEPRHVGRGFTTAVSPPDLETKRRRLLENNDWSGIQFQKPLTAGPQQDTIGGTRASASALAPRRKGHLVEAQTPYHHRAHSRNTEHAPPDNRITIRVGSQDFRWSNESNTIRSQPHAGSLPSIQDWMSRDTSRSPHTPSSTHSIIVPLSANKGDQLGRQPTHWSSHQPRHETQKRDYPQGHKGASYADKPPQFARPPRPLPIKQPRPERIENTSLLDLQPPSVEISESIAAQVGETTPPDNHYSLENVKWREWLTSPGYFQSQRDASKQLALELRLITPGVSHHWANSDPASSSISGSSNQGQSVVGTVTQGLSTVASPELELPLLQPTSLSQLGPRAYAPLKHTEDYSPALSAPESLDSLNLETLPNMHRSVQPELDEAPPRRRELSAAASPELQLPLLQRESPAQLASKRPNCFVAEPSRENHDTYQNQTPNDLILPMQAELAKPPNVLDLLDLLDEEEPSHDTGISALEQNPGSEDEDEVWRKFVLDDDAGEINRRARAEAHEQTKQQLAQLQYLSSDVAEPPSTHSPSPSPTQANLVTDINDDPPPRHVGAASRTSHSPDDTTMAPSSVIAQSGSPPKPPQQLAEFRFHQPRLFVGRLASIPGSVPAPPDAQSGSAAGKRGRRRGRGARGRELGRPDIRAVPDFEEDPIEEELTETY